MKKTIKLLTLFIAFNFFLGFTIDFSIQHQINNVLYFFILFIGISGFLLSGAYVLFSKKSSI